MPVSPDDAEKLAREIRRLYAAAETELIETLAARLAKGLDLPDWAERKLAQLGAVRRAAQAASAKIAAQGSTMIVAAVEEGYALGIAAIEADIIAGLGASAATSTALNTGAIQALAREATGIVARATSTIIRTVPDAYQAIIVDSSAQVLTGSVTRRVATQRAVNRFVDKGITRFVDASNRVWNLDSYAEMATRTTTGRAAVQGGVDRMARSNITLALVSDSPEECALCEPWEGVVVTTGSDEGYPTLDDAEAEGLFHPNCTHSLGAYIPGVTEAGKAKSNPAGREQRARQRDLERNVRKWKRREAGSLDATAKAAARNKVRAANAKLTSHINEFDRKRIPGRTSIIGP